MNGGRGEVLEGGGREVGMLELLALLHLLALLDLGVGAIGLIGAIGAIGLEVWSDGLCIGHPSSRSVVFAPFRTIPTPVEKRRHVHSLARGRVCGSIYYIGVIVRW